MTIKLSMTRIASALLAITPILAIYRVGPLPLNFGDLACVIVVLFTIYDIVKKQIRLKKCYFLVYFAACFLVSLIMILIRGRFDFADFAAKWLRLVVFYCVIDISAYHRVDYKVFVKWNLAAGMITSTLLYVQVIGTLIFARPIFFYLNIVPFFNGMSASEVINMYTRVYSQGGWRAFSVFFEPSHYAAFSLLPLSIAMFSGKEILFGKKKVFCSIFIAFAILLSRSAIGLFCSIMLFVVWYFRSLTGRVTLGKIIIAILAGAAVICLLVSTEYFDFAMDRVRSAQSSGMTTGTQRLLQGIEVYKGIPLLEKIVGLGYGNLYSYLVSTRFVTNYVQELGNEYMNSFSCVLNSSGIIGFIVYMAIWISIYFEKRDIESRAAFLLITVLFLVTAAFYYVTPVIYLVFVRCPKPCDRIEQ